MKTYGVRLELLEPMLGTAPLNKEQYEEWILSKHPDLEGEDELESVETLEELAEKGTTGFRREDGEPIIYDYMIKGFLKDACGMLRRADGTRSAKMKAYKRVIDGLVFVKPRRIAIDLNGGELGILDRPLRAQTAQGERITLARSETVPVGSTLEFQLLILGDVSEDLLREWLDYGALRGLGQWRNGGYGAFTYELS